VGIKQIALNGLVNRCIQVGKYFRVDRKRHYGWLRFVDFYAKDEPLFIDC
jgi:hypothetical protein